MTPKSDESAKSGTLPEPQLNPLLNPILDKNLGRWAEVYFTNPPDRRDEAVLNLVRQLESEGETPESAPRRKAQLRAEKQSSAVTSDEEKAAICPACGFENEVHQRFCGECGAPLAAPAVVPRPSPAPIPPTEHAYTSGPGERIKPMSAFGSILHLSDPVLPALNSGSADDRPYSNPRSPGTEEESAPLGRSYRLYVGMILVIIIGGLLYLAWRGGQSAPERSLFPAQAPPAAVQPSSPAAEDKLQAPPQTPTSSPATTPAAATRAAVGSAEKPQNAIQQAPKFAPPAVPNNSAVVSANGNQELATALSFLNGTGQQHDSAAAAQWLWRAVEKKNTTAIVLLAGLYLRGDGVQKNCDQGRVLLDAAANKGNKNAASLLQNLPAFGCE